jgi:acetyltransferase-like isoleucine patch superfamily enzyme
VSSARDLAARRLPPPEYALNHVVCRVPLAGARMALYRALGVRMEEPGSGVIMLGCEVFAPRRLELGRGTVVGPRCLLDARGGIRLGRDVNVSGRARFMTAKHLVQDPDFAAAFEPAVVGDRVWIALGATILGGVTIGEGAVVAANATVTADVAPYAIVAGTPARVIGRRTGELRYHLDYRPDWL